MDKDFAKEIMIRSHLKSKGYVFEAENQYWVREWSTNEGKESFLEVAVRTDDGEWNKLMMNSSGKVFYAECTGEEIY